MISIFNKMKNNRIRSLLINILVLIVILVCYNCNFESNDDIAMKNIVSGYYGTPDYHLVYINSIIGFLLSKLYVLFPLIPWYEILLYFILLSSFIIIFYVLINKKNKTIWLVSITVIIASFFCYYRLQYTKVAIISSLAGYLLLHNNLKENNKISIIAIIFLTFSILIRKKAFFCSTLLCSTIFIKDSIISLKKKNKPYIRKIIAIVFSLLFILLTTEIINNLSYTTNEWSDYMRFNELRALLFDGGMPDYYANDKEFERIGIINQAYSLFRNNCIDTNVFSNDVLESIIKIKTNLSIKTFVVLFISNSIKFFLCDRNLMYSFLFILVLLLYLFFSNDDYFLNDLITLFMFIIINIYCFAFRNHIYTDRVSISLLLCLIIILLYHFDSPILSKHKTNMMINTFIIFVLLAFSICLSSNHIRFITDYSEVNNKADTLNIISKDTKNLYLWKTREDLYYEDIFINRKVTNVLCLGGWLTNSPISSSIQKKYNVNNVFLDCIDNNVIFITQEDINDIVNYIINNYNEDVTANYISSINGYKLYKINSN